MKLQFKKALAALAGLAMAAAGLAGCSSGAPESTPEVTEGTHEAQLELSLFEFQNIQDFRLFPHINYTITCTGTNYTKSGSFSSTKPIRIQGIISDVPVGANCKVALTATSIDNIWTCTGTSRSFKERCTDNDDDDLIRIPMTCSNRFVKSWHRIPVIGQVNVICRAPDAGVDAGSDARNDAPDAQPDVCVPRTTCPTGQMCGSASNGCGGTITSCGTCPMGQTCNASNQCVCQPLTAAQACVNGQNCGSASDGCGSTVPCGTCTGTNTCGGGGVANHCGCTPATTCPAGQQCGTAPNGCGGTVTCAACPTGTSCNASNQCVCVPTKTVCTGGQMCGTQDNGCGVAINCGTCPTNTNCNAAGQCVSTCPTTCSAGNVCGTQAFPGCPSVNCGTCTAPQTCDGTNHCVCVPKTACTGGQACGTQSDNCGGVVNCGPCPTGTSCNASNQCVCVPTKTACTGGQQCGTQDNGCGVAIPCGNCAANETCNAQNVCVCVPRTTCPAGQICGSAPNGCGGMITCGSCPANNACSSDGTTCTPNCIPNTACTGGQNCGTQDNGCGTGTINCGTCTAPATCGGGGTPNVCGSPAVNHCDLFNNGGACTPTEQRFVDKSVDCYECMANAGCLDDALFQDINHECADVAGTATAGAASGTSRNQLCLDTIDCILNPANVCASTDVTICYCGTLGAGNGCATAPAGAPNGKCLTQELNGLEHTVDQPPSVVLPDYTALNRGAGMANQLFNCAKSNGCDVLCSQ